MPALMATLVQLMWSRAPQPLRALWSIWVARSRLSSDDSTNYDSDHHGQSPVGSVALRGLLSV